MKKILLIAAGLFAFDFISKKLSVKDNLKIDVVNVKINGGFIDSRLTLTLLLTNPVNTTILVSSIKGKIATNNKLLGSFISNESVVIPANGSINFSIDVNVSTITTILSLLNIIQNKTGAVAVNGVANVEGFEIPFNQIYNF
jgi:LEA14-like dessication related protein